MNQVREPVVSGTFYEMRPDALQRDLDQLFYGTKRGTCSGVVSPHAGYVYSGRCAARAIASLEPAKTFIILGPNHNLCGPEFSVMGHGFWETPLGRVEIAEYLAHQLKRNRLLVEDSFAHEREHSIEVQLPLMQHVFGSFRFVPISISNTSYSDTFLGSCLSLGRTLAAAGVPIIASSDFSHYVPLEKAKHDDMEAIRCIESLDAAGLFAVLKRNNASVCGFGPIAVLISAMKELRKKGKLIAYTSSGDATKDYKSVVAYAAIGFS